MQAAMHVAEAAKDDVGVPLYAQQVMYFMLWVCSLRKGLICCIWRLFYHLNFKVYAWQVTAAHPPQDCAISSVYTCN